MRVASGPSIFFAAKPNTAPLRRLRTIGGIDGRSSTSNLAIRLRNRSARLHTIPSPMMNRATSSAAMALSRTPADLREMNRRLADGSGGLVSPADVGCSAGLVRPADVVRSAGLVSPAGVAGLTSPALRSRGGGRLASPAPRSGTGLVGGAPGPPGGGGGPPAGR